MKKVLIVDDERSVRKLVQATLRKEQVTVFQAINGMEALSISKTERPDLIVMDVILPGQSPDGIALTRQIKRDPATADCKVLLISGVLHINDEELVSSGADGFLSKPFNPIKLRAQINMLLGEEPQICE